MRKRGEAWELRVFRGYDPVTGKQRYAYKTVRAASVKRSEHWPR